MAQQDESVNKKKLTQQEINEQVRKYPDYYQALVTTMFHRGASAEEVQKEINKFSHMY